MRKMSSSAKALSRIWLSSCAEAQIVAEGLFDDDAGAFGAAGLDELFDDRCEKHRRNRQVVRGMLGVRRVPCASAVKVAGSLVVAVDVTQQPAELFQRSRIESAVLFRGCLWRGLSKLIEIPARPWPRR